MSKKGKEKVPIKKETAITPARPTPPLDMFKMFDDMFDHFQRSYREWRPWRGGALERFIPEFPTRDTCTDIVDAGKEFQVCAEVPGIPKDKIDITVSKDGIEISAETEAEKEEKEKNFVRRERGYARIYKKLTFPEDVIPDKAIATVKEGLLVVKIPKKTPTAEPKKQKVEVK